MEIRHYIDNQEIDEPIGFDNFKTTIKRDSDYHGMSAETSVGELEFYGKAANLIAMAFAENIDIKLIYTIKFDGDIAYEGIIDLSTYKEINGNYRSISCKVGEIGIKTTFNQRSDIDIDLNDDNDYVGTPLAGEFKWHNLIIPPKNIIYTNRVEQNVDLTYSGSNSVNWHMPDDFQYALLVMLPEEQIKNEFGSIDISGLNGYCGKIPIDNDGKIGDWDGIVSHFFLKSDENWNEKYGNNSKYSANIKLNIKLSGSTVFEHVFDDARLEFTPIVFYYRNKQVFVIKEFETQTWRYDPTFPVLHNFLFNVECNLTGLTYDKLYVAIKIQNYNNKNGKYFNNPFSYEITLAAGSFIEMKLDSVKPESIAAPMMLVGDAVAKIVAKLSEQKLAMASEWLKYDINAPNERIGGGAMKAITNGYKIRGSYDSGYGERTMPMSFKTMMESLNCLDCIGWGFSNENDNTVLRIEKWDWFYNENVLMEIDDADEITRSIDTERIVTSVNIGYKKYTTNEEISSVDSIFGERTFVSTMTSISNEKKLLCEFIADNYAIELTRRNATLKTDSEYKYDENIFIFSLVQEIDFNAEGRVTDRALYINPDITDSEHAENLIKPDQTINAILSPERCLWRWNRLLFLANGATTMTFASGKLNCNAKFGTRTSSYAQDSSMLYLYDELQQQHQEYAENGEITKINRKFKAETIELTYPMTFAQYKKIKHDPYGIVMVSGERCWIKEFTYSFADGTANFKLIPQAKN